MKSLFIAACVALILSGCKSTENQTSLTQSSSVGAGLDRCFGYRGNGSSLFASIGGIARLFDQFGSPSATFGTSSGSVAAFLTESLMVPGGLYECQGCDTIKIAERRSFMLKAFPLLMNAMADSDGLSQDFKAIQAGKKEYETLMKLFKMPAPVGDSAAGTNALLNSVEVRSQLNTAALLLIKSRSQEIKTMINPEFYKISGIGGIANPVLVNKAIDNIISFQGASTTNTFTRQDLMIPGMINFNYLFINTGILADWYAGYASNFPQKELSALLDACATGSRGIWWNELAAKPLGASTCGKEYYRLFSSYFNVRKKTPIGKMRINERIGTYIPAFVSTAAIGGNDVVASMSSYADAGEWDKIDALDLDRTNFKVLYFGPQNYRALINARKGLFSDVVTKNIVSMGPLTWLQAMKASGQEPGTDRATLFTQDGQNYLAVGGFVDQIQAKMMKMAGCKQTIAITTNSPILTFAGRYAPMIWNKDKDLVNDLFDPQDPRSAESVAFTNTSALLCSLWETYGLSETWEMADGSYHNFLFTLDADLLTDSTLFKRKNGVLTTKTAPPKSCYAVKNEKDNQFPAYHP